MKPMTIYNALIRAMKEKHRIAETRSSQLVSNWGIAVQKNETAREWQRRERQRSKFAQRLEEYLWSNSQ